MYCPVCGQQQATEQTRFCSRCGFPLAGVAELVANGGTPSVLPERRGDGNTPRQRGLKQGLFIFLLAFLVVPILTIITIASGSEPYVVVISAILLGVGGLLRAAYALMFESNIAADSALGETAQGRSFSELRGGNAGSLPPQQSVPAADFVPPAGYWKNTNDLHAEPASVTERTTNLLERENESDR